MIQETFFHSPKVYLFGFSRWKHGFIKSFLKEYESRNIFFINPIFSSFLDSACKKGMDATSEIYVWGKKEFPDIEEFAAKNALHVTRVEDGFIRSVGLGSDLTQPYSLVVDKHGIYFDPSQRSDLEDFLNTYNFKNDALLLARAKSLVEKIIATKISKYNADTHQVLTFATNKKLVLVPGQVEDDASIRLGAEGMKNIELLQKVRENMPNDFIIFKPHPDVLSGNRVGHINENEALVFCDIVVQNVSMASVLEVVEEVHTMTSLTGFEALLYGKKVTTYGMPFYAGWGLTQDMHKIDRRTRDLNLMELVAGTLLLYPRYLHPQSQKFCTPEEVLLYIEAQKKKLESSLYLRLVFKFRNFLSRWAQKFLSLVA